MSELTDPTFALPETAGADAALSGGAAVLDRLLPSLLVGRARFVMPTGRRDRQERRDAGAGGDDCLPSLARRFAGCVTGGDIGFAEAYIDADWTSPDLVAVLRLASRNAEAWKRTCAAWTLVRWANRLRHLMRGNSRRGSQAQYQSPLRSRQRLLSAVARPGHAIFLGAVGRDDARPRGGAGARSSLASASLLRP